MTAPQPIDLGNRSGPLLVFGGVYSNLEALTALRTEAERRGIPPGNVICTGDTPGYCADPEACLNLQENWGIYGIAGNVEINLRSGVEDCGCNFSDGSRCDMFARLWYAYARAEVGERGMAYMRTLPERLSFFYAGRRVHVLHGSAEHESEFVWKSTDWAVKQRSFDRTGADVILASHSGLPFTDGRDGKLWINSGALGMPANDGTPRTWYAILDDTEGAIRVTFHPLPYDVATARAKMLQHRTRLPLSYATTLVTGIWDNTEIMPPTEAAEEGRAMDPDRLGESSTPAPRRPSIPHPTTDIPQPTTMNPYSDPKDLRTFGKITEWQEEMGEKFFNWYSGVTEGDSALTEREKALIALAVSHAIQCSYCIDAYTTNSLQAGADEEQMMEAVHVAAAVKAGTTLIYARQMQRQVEKVTM
ncbi:alkylhydroperoxidase/carboxymuconolactone decarboxylase family protein [Neolewinella xylanilytica]|uniref:Alkylhydroperoxidase/carboxymuconolactone decarboxylase family protein n=2 Tax=Neolewinella xylanilytica TaxID=1514080 RepID=A0A2S6I0C1_9BACT|nr:arsenosugar biosynthesis-associated peroxidase-like protein [Neolewinella xylanilytica]PPK84306.1 alkylhydroperoxidase/carboxymuconolactone decarboxylase family protein [Neolewinella xylanilytica]